MVACLITSVMGVMGAALAAGSAEKPPKVEGKVLNKGPSGGGPGANVLPSFTPSQRGASTLPFTGADVTLFVIVGVAAIGVGTLLVRRTRSARHTS